MPASNMKIVTLAAAAETLGWDYRFKTTLETTATIDGGVLKGDLIVRGTRRSDHQQPRRPRHGGVRRVGGGAEGGRHHPHRRQRRRRRHRVRRRGLGQGWSWDYLQDGYAAPVVARSSSTRTSRRCRSAPAPKPGDDAALELPPGTGLGLVHHVVTGAPGIADDDRRRAAARRRLAGRHRARLPSTRTPVSRDVAVANPPLYFAHSFADSR